MPARKGISYILFFGLIALLFIFNTQLKAQEAQKKEGGQPEDLVEFMEEGMKEIDYYSLEELLNTEVEIASLFAEDELVVGSTVSSISPEKWKMIGAKRNHEALGNEMSVAVYPTSLGSYMFAIRGYTITGSDKGIASLIDGVPITGIIMGGSIYTIPNWELGTLNRIEMIKGPGSAIYGSDAFHGVISMKTFESDKDSYSVEGAGAYPLYGDANVKISQGFGENLVRIDAAASASYQGDQDLEYEYNDPVGYNGPGLPIPAAEGTSKRDFQYDSQTGVFKVGIQPADKLKIKLGGYFNRGKYDKYPGVFAIVNSFDPQSTALIPSQDNDFSWSENTFMMATGGIDYSLYNNISVEASGYFWTDSREFTISVLPEIWGVKNVTNETETRGGGQIIIKQPDNAFNIQWLAAYSYTKMDVKEQEIDIYIPISMLPPSLQHQEPESYINGFSRNIHSIFAQTKWGAIKNRLFVILGGRNDYYSDFGNQITPRGGLIFLPSAKSSVKALYGRAFRAPSSIELKGRESLVKGDNNLKPEIIDIYELIYMYKEKKWKASVNGFYSYWKNGIIMEKYMTSGFRDIYANKGKNDSIGGELSLFYLIEPVTLDLGFSYVKSRALDVKSPDDPSETVDQDYNLFPEYSINAGIYYTLKPADITFYLNNMIYLNMKEAPTSVMANPGKLPPYYRMDINASKIISNKLELYLNVKNVLDRENRMPSVLGSENGYVEPGISVMLRAGYKL